jgi:hypothetical protein
MNKEELFEAMLKEACGGITPTTVEDYDNPIRGYKTYVCTCRYHKTDGKIVEVKKEIAFIAKPLSCSPEKVIGDIESLPED